MAEEDRYERAVLVNNAQDPKALRRLKPADERGPVAAPFPVHASQVVMTDG